MREPREIIRSRSRKMRLQRVVTASLFMLIFSLYTTDLHATDPVSVWPGTAVPGVVDSGPDDAVELGVNFRSDTNGFITGIRFYKASTNTGTHVGNLWSSTGTLLATATFTNETASGWQQVNFTSPVPIIANTTYVASYHTNVGHYSFNYDFFASQGLDNPPLHVPVSSTSAPNGVFAYGSGSNFPTGSWRSSNYWVDVVFIALPSTMSSSSIWTGSAVPGTADTGPDDAVELGVNFRSDTSGYVTGIRFYKSSANTGTHVGNLWTSSGTLLATATFANETASGWQQVEFASPVPVIANTTYVASYHTSAGHYSSDYDFFASQGLDNPPLHFPVNGAGTPNGVFAYGTGSNFPSQSWRSSNYWVDVVISIPVFTFTITVTAGTGGSVSPATATVDSGGSQTFTITPGAGYRVAAVAVDGASQGAVNSYTFNNVTANHTLAATFEVDTPQPSMTSNYFYDDLGQLARVVNGTAGVVYTYDDLGNLVSTTSATTTSGSPVLNNINPNTFFVGSKMLVTITGQNLLTTQSVTSTNGLVSIDNIKATDTRITAEMTALSPGNDTLTVTTLYGTPNAAATSVTLTSSKLTISPGQLALAPGTSGTLTATISPVLGAPLTINLGNNAPSVATVPQTVTIPASGSAGFTVNAITSGVAMIDAGDPRAIVFVANPYVWDAGESVLGRSSNVSVMIDSPLGTSPASSSSVSVIFDTPAGTSPATSNPVSVIFDTPAGTSQAISGGISVQIQ